MYLRPSLLLQTREEVMPSIKRPTEVPDKIKKALTGDLKDPQVREIAAHFFHIAGGPKAVALLLYQEFEASKPGSLMRQRILQLVLNATKYANEQAGRGPLDELGLLSEQDIEREILSLLEKSGDKKEN